MNKLAQIGTAFCSLMVWCTLAFGQPEIPKIPAEITNYQNQLDINKKNGIKYSVAMRYAIENSAVTTQKYKEYTLKYDPSGKPIEKEIYNRQGTILSIHTYRYKPNNLPTEIIKYNPRGMVQGKTNYIYGERSCLLEKQELDEHGTLLSKEKYSKDLNKNELAYQVYVRPDSILYRMVYTYNDLDSGRLEGQRKYVGKQLVFRTEIERNASGEKEEYYYGKDDQVTYKLVYKEDHLGNVTEVTRVLSSDNTMPKFIYQYDGKGNVTGFIEYNSSGQIIRYYKYQHVYK